MHNIAVEISTEELRSVGQAYQTIEHFLEKLVPPNELYHTEFLQGLEESLDEAHNGQLTEVQNFADFIGAFK